MHSSPTFGTLLEDVNIHKTFTHNTKENIDNKFY
jgi:hypothetical protein